MFSSKFFHANGVVLGAPTPAPATVERGTLGDGSKELSSVSKLAEYEPRKKLIRKSSLLSPRFGVKKVLFGSTGTIKHGCEEEVPIGR